MYLKTLHLHGFKTFAAKTELHFEPGITAIVGPNGSGKSNIADAIRWVLGEQSAKSLRSGRMEDVIFGGSRKARPLGFADVLVTLDNQDRHFALDFGEVAIRRRYHRSGESEFNLNKTTCRLADIQNMLMDTGLGKGSYSIIGQGQVASVLSSKPEERRSIFEEAAGINRFKHQKRKAEARLDNTQANLFRLGDIINELESRLPSLEVEAERAERARELSDRVNELERAIFLADFKKLKGEMGQMATVLGQLEELTLAAEADQNKVELSLEEIQLKFSEAEKTLHHLAQEKTRLEADRTQWQNRLKHHGELTRTLNKERERAQASQGQIASRLKEIEGELTALAQKAQALQTQREEAQEAFARCQEAAQRVQGQYQEMASQAGEKQKELLQAVDALTKLKERLATLGENRRWRQMSLEQLAGQLQELAQQAQQTGEALAQAQADQQAHQSQRDEKAAALAGQKAAMQQAQTSLETMQKEREEVLKALSKASAEQTLLRQLQEQGEGLEEGIRRLREASKKGEVQGFAGVLGELLHAPQHLLDALEAVLGPQLQVGVFEGAAQAAQAMDWVIASQKGRAVLWGPNGVATPDPLPGSLAGQVQAEPAAAPLVAHLLGRVILVEKLEHREDVTQVTPQGRVRLPGGLLLGGKATGAALSPLRRREALDRLEKTLAELNQRKTTIDQQSEEARQTLAAARAQVDELALAVDHLERALAVSREQVSQHTRHLERVQKDIAARQQEKSAMEEKDSQENGEYDALAAQHETLAASHARLEEERTTLASHQEALLREKEAHDEALSAARVRLSEVQGALGQAQALRQNLEAEQGRLSQTLAEVEKTLTATQEELLTLANFEEEYETAMTGLSARQQQLQQQMEHATSHELAVHEELASLQGRKRTLQESARQARERWDAERLREARLQSKAEEMLAQAQELLGLSPGEVASATQEEVKLEHGARAETKRLKDELKEMGFVNLGAIAEKRSVQERLNFLKTHYEDLFEARARLLEMIGKIEEQTKEAFLATFEAVRVAFNDLFGGMVPGGSGDLSLSEPEAPLESGIEIMVQMPGKARGPLTRLSGGEQTLTAITLLFAILKVKPSPFCLLDEIEAALDEPNTVRFTRFLRDFSHEVQFIVITHNKRTMEAADALLGVTMEEDGISKIVSVKLNQVQPAAAAAAVSSQN